MVLALAKYFAQLGEKTRRTLVFLFTAGHFYGGAEGIGQKAFIETHRDDIAKAIIDISVEHVAKECLEKDGWPLSRMKWNQEGSSQQTTLYW